MGEEDQGSEIRVSNWTLATGTRPGERVPIDVGSGRSNAQPPTLANIPEGQKGLGEDLLKPAA
jgi:hypothetical protein